MINQRYMNRVVLEGTVHSEPSLSYCNKGAKFYKFMLQVRRLSGAIDILPVLAIESKLSLVAVGEKVTVVGNFRSRNNPDTGYPRVFLYVLARCILPSASETHNHITLAGELCKPRFLRMTPTGKILCNMTVRVRRKSGVDYLPVIAWDSLANQCAQMEFCEKIVLEGRVQSREYVKMLSDGFFNGTAYEVSMMSLGIDEKEGMLNG